MKCYLCQNESTAVCYRCGESICNDHFSKNSQSKIIYAEINQQEIDFSILCSKCEKKEQRKRIIALSIFASILIAIALTLMILRFGGIWIW